MTSPQGMDELFWGKDHENINDWCEPWIIAQQLVKL
jgi:hypothetical protein